VSLSLFFFLFSLFALIGIIGVTFLFFFIFFFFFFLVVLIGIIGVTFLSTRLARPLYVSLHIPCETSLCVSKEHFSVITPNNSVKRDQIVKRDLLE